MNGDSNADDFNLPQSVQTLIKHDQNWGSIYRDEAEEPLKDIISSYGRLMGSEAEAVAKRWTEEVLQALETPSNPGFNFSDYLNKTKIVDTFGALNSDVKHFLYARSKHETITEDARLVSLFSSRLFVIRINVIVLQILPIDKNNGVLRINENYKPKVFVSKLGLKVSSKRTSQSFAIDTALVQDSDRTQSSAHQRLVQGDLGRFGNCDQALRFRKEMARSSPSSP